ncbi:PepSY-associated TM helix domain-containing protein [Sphingomonas radiodurans]|uniref:PepSY-associated TM helix domain-containing protein n=1 Tax=Sphingomonas radiodurans TaxID=2890321 RepID=UPI001E655F58|nr:PepSY-associated TM helix domain-containing protein [Sphingomonas radiodurans]WBH18067.1 PepSY-associated TM helix domain-containing protein [Sphingomonas radiodurans]
MTNMTPMPQSLVKRALGGHAAIGLLVSAMLYLIALSGTIVVIHDRWQRWEQPAIAESGAVLSPAAAQAAMTAAVALDKGKPPTTHLYIRMPTDDLPRAVVTTDHAAWYVDGAGRVVGREGHAWTEFLIELHEYLHLPMTWGMIVVGALGVALAALVVTGVLAHPRIVRDAFSLRARHDPQVARADWHNRLGVWTLPFALAVALTGAFIGLGSVGFSMLARAYTGGDMEAVYAPIFGTEPTPNAAPAPLPNVAAALTAVATRVPEASPIYVIVHDPRTAGQHVQILAEHPRRLVYGESYQFGEDGTWHGPVGIAGGTLGQQSAGSAYNLHFGNYGGLVVELAYMLLGLALCAITATGTTLWLTKRQRRGLPSARMSACWTIVVWGTPLAIIGAAWLRGLAGPDAPLVAAFWGVLAVALIVAAARPAWVVAARLRDATFVATIVTGLGHAIVLRPDVGAVLALDAGLVAFGLFALMAPRWFVRPVTEARTGRVDDQVLRGSPTS